MTPPVGQRMSRLACGGQPHQRARSVEHRLRAQGKMKQRERFYTCKDSDRLLAMAASTSSRGLA